MKKSDKVENEVRIQLDSREGFTWKELWGEVLITKALLKHVIDNDLKHIWRIITIILSYLVAFSIGYILKALKVF